MEVIRHPRAGAGAVATAPLVARWRRKQETVAPVMLAQRSLPSATEVTRFAAPFHLFCLLTFVIVGRPNDYFLWLVPLRIALVFTVLTVVATLLRWREATPSPFAAKETKLYLCFYAAMVGGIPFAVYRPGAFDYVITQYVVNVAFFLLFLVHVDSVAKLRRVAGVLVLSVFLYTVFGFVSGQFMQGRYFTGSGMFDPNDVAFFEVYLLGFALWVLVGRFGFAMKAVALSTVLSGVLLTLYTASRGGLLGLLAFLLLFLWLHVPTVSKSFKGVLLAILIVGAFANADKINIQRYQTLGSLENDYNLQGDGGRVDTWKRGIRLFLDDPLTGVGVGGFGKAIGEQRLIDGDVPRWQTAHNAYILVLTETGIVGAAAFLLLIVTSVRTFNRLRRVAGSLPDRELAVLPGFLLVSFGAQLVAALFLSQAYSMFFTLAFALSAALNRLTANAATTSHRAPGNN